MNDIINLIKQANEHISYWEGEGVGAYIEADLNSKDYESLKQHLKASANIIFDIEYNLEPEELSDDDIENIVISNRQSTEIPF